MNGEVTEPNRVAAAFGRGNLVKICGLREPEHAAFAAAAGADLLSFIFAPARRQVTAEMARACLDAAREAASEREIVAIGVFVDADSSVIEQTVSVAGLDAVQLSGRESPAYVQTLGVPSIKALCPRRNDRFDDVLAEIETFNSPTGSLAGFLLDGSSGTGERADWDFASAVSARHSVMLAGGLDPENVRDAIQTVHPLGVDVSSGVETNGVKDLAKIEAFILAAREGFRS